jgi:hypothetical protein
MRGNAAQGGTDAQIQLLAVADPLDEHEDDEEP